MKPLSLFQPTNTARIFIFMIMVMTWQAGARTPSFTSSPISNNSFDSATTTWLVLRHAERDGEADRLSPAGLERAEMLQQLGQLLNVDVIYSTDTARTRNTVAPLANVRDLKIQSYAEATAEWLTEIRSRHIGKVVMIVGHSNTAGVIAGQLARQKVFPIAHDEYDCLFIVTTTGSASARSPDGNPADSVAISPPRVVRLKFGPSSIGTPSAGADQMGPVKNR